MIYVLLACRWALALLLLGAGVSKIGSRAAFSDVIARYALVPRDHALWLAVVLPWAEIVVGLALTLGLAPAVSGLCASLMLTGFTIAVGVNLARGRRFDCGCGGAAGGEIGWWLFTRNLFLIAIGAWVAVGPAGLALSGETLGGGQVHVAARDLLPIPLIVVAVFTLLRCVQSFVSGRLPPDDQAREAS